MEVVAFGGAAPGAAPGALGLLGTPWRAGPAPCERGGLSRPHPRMELRHTCAAQRRAHHNRHRHLFGGRSEIQGGQDESDRHRHHLPTLVRCSGRLPQPPHAVRGAAHATTPPCPAAAARAPPVPRGKPPPHRTPPSTRRASSSPAIARGRDTRQLANDIIAAGIEAVLTCVDPKKLPPSFAGRRFDAQLLKARAAAARPPAHARCLAHASTPCYRSTATAQSRRVQNAPPGRVTFIESQICLPPFVPSAAAAAAAESARGRRPVRRERGVPHVRARRAARV